MKTITASDLPRYIDQTLLKPFATTNDLRAFCEAARPCGFATVMISSAAVAKCREFLEDAKIGAVIGFCLGQSPIRSKVFEAIETIEAGADEIDYVANFGELKSGNLRYVEDEMRAITEACHERSRLVKVIFENCYLTDAEKEQMCEIALRVKPDFIKTSTGFGTGGATLADVQLMKRMVGNNVQVKAAGGIRTLDDAEAYLKAGATRLGCSAGAQLVEQMKRENRVILLDD